MKRIFVLLLALLIAGCQASVPVQPVTKLIVSKMQSVEQRLDWDPFDSHNSVRTRATTVYRMVADDASYVEVSLHEYLHAKEGEKYSSTRWRD